MNFHSARRFLSTRYRLSAYHFHSLHIGYDIPWIAGEFPTQRPVMQSFDGSFDLCFKKGFSKQLWGWWFETPPHSLWRHRNVKELRSLLPILSRDSKWIWAGSKQCFMMHCPVRTLIARFMGPTGGPSGPDKTQVGPKSFAIWEWVSCECKCNHEGVISYSLHLELGTTYFEVLLAKKNKAVWSTKCIFLIINKHRYLKEIFCNNHTHSHHHVYLSWHISIHGEYTQCIVYGWSDVTAIHLVSRDTGWKSRQV